MYAYHRYLNPFIVDNLAQSTLIREWDSNPFYLIQSLHIQKMLLQLSRIKTSIVDYYPSKNQVCPRKTKRCNHNQMKQQ
jgi:hypothetical protein